MELILLLAGPYSACEKSQQIWQDECRKYNIDLAVMYLESEAGQSLARQLNLKSFPALISGTEIIAVGHPDKKTAGEILAGLDLNRRN